jgi:hypothetical protein
MHLFKAAIHHVSFCTSLIVAGAPISMMAVIHRTGFNSPVADDEPEKFS